MNTQELKGINKNNIVLGPKYFESKRINKFKSMYDSKTENTIVMVNLDRATIYEAKDFSEYMEDLIKNNKTKLIIDIENVYFMDSVFFGTLIKFLKQVTKLNGHIKLIIDHKSKPELLSINNFEGIFEIYQNLFDALNKKKTS